MSLRESLINEEIYLMTRLDAVRSILLLYNEKGLDNNKISLLDIKKYISEQGLNSKSRKQNLVHQRFYLATYVKVKFNLKLDDIGGLFGVKHDTIIYYCNQHDLKNNKDLRYQSNVSVLQELFPF